MKMITKKIEKVLIKTPLYSKEGIKPKNTPVIVKFFAPWTNWTWYVVEGRKEGNDWLFYGLVEGFEKELGYFRLSELKSIKGPYGLKIERDMYFGEHNLSEFI